MKANYITPQVACVKTQLLFPLMGASTTNNPQGSGGDPGTNTGLGVSLRKLYV